MQDFAEQLHLDRYTLFMQDYGGPVGFRMALAHPEKIQAMIIQNAVSHEEGLSSLWAVRQRRSARRSAYTRCGALRAGFKTERGHPIDGRLREASSQPLLADALDAMAETPLNAFDLGHDPNTYPLR